MNFECQVSGMNQPKDGEKVLHRLDDVLCHMIIVFMVCHKRCVVIRGQSDQK